ncbi:TPA: NAD-dependent epimerase/dehydratase family protein [Vibrio cholerae]|nr:MULTISPECIES: NAD-dependent epimerase/dehydratase family protein [Vibrio]EGR2534757.1 NAD-dependent epimerase/dehydratase family protein [Vibrio cholerae]EGR4406704.1 NAD-dependent epimerase/dehydratase family protein [Vibrio cholerae]KFD79632.1 3-beta hydroxysteroid dehydrogenase/isomerase family protein [Vibrio paracholerae]MCO7030092.1 NAD-dependent epimerase/dehydratase family protein [Vibrio paracholerae]MCX9462017.1 NAD-dependent epimerase/dehydratase family protein [Vibrio cholerae]
MAILLTGATGFVGQEVVKLKREFRCVVRLGETHSFMDSYEISGIDESTEWSDCFHGVDSVIHLAGLAHNKSFSEAEYRCVNTNGTLRLAKKAAEAGVRRFVFVSSIGVNGTSTIRAPFTQYSKENPHNYYAQSKYDAELGLKKISEDTELEVVIVRPTLVYGANAPGNFGLLTNLVSKFPILPFGLAHNRRDFIAVQNLVDLLITCAIHPAAAGHTFLASDGETVSTKHFTNAIAEGLGKKVIQLPIPVSFMRFVGKLVGKSTMIEQLYGDLEVDSSNIKEVLDWTPPLTMKQAMDTLRDFREK